MKQNGSLKYDSKNNVTFFFHDFTKSRFLPATDLSNLSI